MGENFRAVELAARCESRLPRETSPRPTFSIGPWSTVHSPHRSAVSGAKAYDNDDDGDV